MKRTKCGLCISYFPVLWGRSEAAVHVSQDSRSTQRNVCSCGLRVLPLLYRSRKLVVCRVQKEMGNVHGGSMGKSKTREEAPTIPRRRGGRNMKGDAVRPQGILFLSERNFRLTGKTRI